MELPSIVLRYKNKPPNKKGEIPLILQIIHKRKITTKAVGILVAKDSLSGNEIIGRDKLTMLRNMKIREMITDLEKKFMTLMERDQLNDQSIKNVVSGNKITNLTMTEVFKRIEDIYSGILSKSRMKSLRSSVKKFDIWSNQISIENIDSTLLLTYEGYLRKEKEHSETTIWSDMMDLKSLLKKAFDNKIINCDPFAGYKNPTYKAPKRSYLTVDEVNKIEAYADNPEKNLMLRLVAAWFILGCYSGMRYGDLQSFDESRMIFKDRIYFSDLKTGTPHFIPLYPKLIKAIERVRHLRSIPENQLCNRSLKEIARSEDCNISTNVTMHIARHTFAVTYLNNGGTKDVLQKLMGHKKIETTAIYGQITDYKIEDEASKVFNK